MRSLLRKRIEAIEIVHQVKEPKRFFITYTEPYNFWDVTGATVEDQVIERKGDFNDYQTLIDLQQEALEAGRTILKEPKSKGCAILIYVNEVLKDGAEHGNNYNYQGEVPKEITNTHLCKFEGFRSSYTKALELEGQNK